VIDQGYLAMHPVRSVLPNLDSDVCHFSAWGVGRSSNRRWSRSSHRAYYKLHPDTAQKQIVTPLIAEAILPDRRRHLSPVANAVQKQV
jgi:hypothetical protein